RQCDANARRHPLPKRAGGGLYPRCPAVFRMPGTLAVQLPKTLDVLELHCQLSQPLVRWIDGLDLREAERRVEQHRRVPRRANKAVPIGPDRIVRVEAEATLPKRVNHRS